MCHLASRSCTRVRVCSPCYLRAHAWWSRPREDFAHSRSSAHSHRYRGPRSARSRGEDNDKDDGQASGSRARAHTHMNALARIRDELFTQGNARTNRGPAISHRHASAHHCNFNNKKRNCIHYLRGQKQRRTGDKDERQSRERRGLFGVRMRKHSSCIRCLFRNGKHGSGNFI